MKKGDVPGATAALSDLLIQIKGIQQSLASLIAADPTTADRARFQVTHPEKSAG